MTIHKITPQDTNDRTNEEEKSKTDNTGRQEVIEIHKTNSQDMEYNKDNK